MTAKKKLTTCPVAPAADLTARRSRRLTTSPGSPLAAQARRSSPAAAVATALARLVPMRTVYGKAGGPNGGQVRIDYQDKSASHGQPEPRWRTVDDGARLIEPIAEELAGNRVVGGLTDEEGEPGV